MAEQIVADRGPRRHGRHSAAGVRLRDVINKQRVTVTDGSVVSRIPSHTPPTPPLASLDHKRFFFFTKLKPKSEMIINISIDCVPLPTWYFSVSVSATSCRLYDGTFQTPMALLNHQHTRNHVTITACMLLISEKYHI